MTPECLSSIRFPIHDDQVPFGWLLNPRINQTNLFCWWLFCWNYEIQDPFLTNKISVDDISRLPRICLKSPGSTTWQKAPRRPKCWKTKANQKLKGESRFLDAWFCYSQDWVCAQRPPHQWSMRSPQCLWLPWQNGKIDWCSILIFWMSDTEFDKHWEAIRTLIVYWMHLSLLKKSDSLHTLERLEMCILEPRTIIFRVPSGAAGKTRLAASGNKIEWEANASCRSLFRWGQVVESTSFLCSLLFLPFSLFRACQRSSQRGQNELVMLLPGLDLGSVPVAAGSLEPPGAFAGSLEETSRVEEP